MRKLRPNSDHGEFELPGLVSDAPTGNFKNFKFFQNSLKILNIYFWGDNVFFWGDEVYSRGFSKILGFGEFRFCCWGGEEFGDSVGRGAL